MPSTKATFRTNGHLLTVGLFYERCVTFGKDLDYCLFSIDGRTTEFQTPEGHIRPLISAKDTYIDLEDMTGYKWSKRYLESYVHFERLLGATWFRELKDEWDREIEMGLRARALDAVMELAEDVEAPEGTRLSAAKYLAEKGWERRHSKGTGAGRPSKEAVKQKVKEMAEKQTQESEDAERIGLKLVKK